MTRTRTLSLFALAVVGATALAGCSAVDGLLYKQSTQTFADIDALRAGDSVVAEWIPSDATSLTVRASTIEEATDAVVLLVSDELLPASCVEVERLSAPAWALDDDIDVYAADQAWACENWTVIETEGGWYGWTPNAAGEREEAAKAQ